FTSPTTATPHIYPLSLHDALPISARAAHAGADPERQRRRDSPRFARSRGERRHLPVRSPRASARGAGFPAVSRLGSRDAAVDARSEEHTSELQSLRHLVCRLLLEK